MSIAIKKRTEQWMNGKNLPVISESYELIMGGWQTGITCTPTELQELYFELKKLIEKTK